jgi:hypothetical protein
LRTLATITVRKIGGRLLVPARRDDTRVTLVMNAVEHPSAGAQPMATVNPGTLRARLEYRAARGQRLPLDLVVAQVVPLCVEIAEIHAEGYGLYLHPSNVLETPEGGLTFDRELATHLPLHPRDRACLPPETRTDQLNDARANVYAIGALLYELATGESVGQGMRRPSDIVPGLPLAFESILSHALIVDPSQRPADLSALAEAIHQLAPPGSLPSPPHASGPVFTSIPVDVSFSLLPPAPSPVVIFPAQPLGAQPINGYALPQVATINAYGAVVHAPGANGQAGAQSPPSSRGYAAALKQAAPASVNGYAAPAPASANGLGAALPPTPEAKPPSERTEQILELRAQLESDPRARYFVFKGGMDHGPFTALELVQHIDAHDFLDDHRITDTVEQRAALINEWPPFSLFAEHAKRQRELEKRKKVIGQIAAAETTRSRSKTVLGVVLLLAMVGGAGGWYQIQRGSRRDEVEIKADESSNVETDNDLNVKKKKKAARKAGAGGSIAGGQSCEAAIDSYNELKVVGESAGQADITAGQYGRVLNGGTYFSHCGVPNSMSVNICAAVQNGRAVGVTVSTSPGDGQKQACIANAVRNLSFPSHPKLDVTRTRFASQ